MEPVADARDPVFADEFSPTPRSQTRFTSQRQLAKQKLNHSTELSSLLVHPQPNHLEQEVTSLRSLVAQLQSSIIDLQHKGETPREMPPEPQRPPMPIPLKWEDKQRMAAETTSRGDPRPSGTVSTSHAEFAKLKKRHAATIRQSPGRREAQEHVQDIIRSPRTPRESGREPPRQPRSGRSPPQPSFETYRSPTNRTPCAPHTSHAEFTKCKKGHLIDVDSPARRRASEVVPAQPPYFSFASKMSPEHGKRRPTWPDHLPRNALQLMQGRWVSNTHPPRSFEIVGEKVKVEGVESRHTVRLGGFGVQLADITVVAMDQHMIEWDDGDTWERPGRRSPVHRGYESPRANNVRVYTPPPDEVRRGYSTPPSRDVSPTRPHDVVLQPRSVSMHHPREPSHNLREESQEYPRVASQSSQYYPREGSHATRGPSQSYPPPVDDEDQEYYCGDCGGYLDDSPFCPATGRSHVPPSRHVTKGRCPNNHKLTLQSEKLGSVKCSACGVVLPGSRFAGCRVCDYDVCDVCLECADEPIVVTVKRSPYEGTGAICGQTMLLEEVVPGSPADLMGMSAYLGMRVTHINKVQVSSIAEACEAAQDSEDVEMVLV
eukprot:TRINITY_DN16763_c0_g1_i1.p1 TRINITY_DN16763_c0_g1~~TRINITY_DN16763_c0_g1_i1.p1  ORF type:complete len:612 (+),score=134.22 TRINITY_DN16763_c0_g1_i1:32-1837(+)